MAELKIDNNTIPLPHPVITTTDVNYGERIMEEYKINPAFPHQVHEVKELWWMDKLKKVRNSKRRIGKEIGWINEQIGKSSADISIYAPLLAQDIIITSKVKDFFNDLQIKTNVKVINELDVPKANIAETTAQLKKDKRKIVDVGKEPFIQMDMQYNEVAFENKLLHGADYINGITAIWAGNRMNAGTLLDYMRGKKFGRDVVNSIFRIGQTPLSII